MNRPIELVFSENPENDLWEELLQFTYKANILRYSQKHKNSIDEKTIDCIAGAFLQAHEYFMAANDVNLQIAPLLLYYGTTNLLYGMSNLLEDRIIEIHDHGMHIEIPKQIGFMADIEVTFHNLKNGGIHIFAREIGFDKELVGTGAWKLGEFLDSIAEINTDYNRLFDIFDGSKIIMLDEYHTPDGMIEKVYYTEENKDFILELLQNVENFEKSYLPIEYARSPNSEETYFILRHKLNGKDISEISYSGQRYLRSAHYKNKLKITIPTILNMYIALFILSSLCRYHPEIWSPFILNDESGEKLLIEKFLYYTKRMVPNIILNNIYGRDIQYTSAKYKETNTIIPVGEHQVQEIVRKEVNKQMETIKMRDRIKENR